MRTVKRRRVFNAPENSRDNRPVHLPKNHKCHGCPMYDRANVKLFCPVPNCIRETIDRILPRMRRAG